MVLPSLQLSMQTIIPMTITMVSAILVVVLVVVVVITAMYQRGLI